MLAPKNLPVVLDMFEISDNKTFKVVNFKKPIIIALCDGGQAPPFSEGENQNGQPTVTINISDDAKFHLDAFVGRVIAKAVVMRKQWFKAGVSAEYVADNMNAFVSKPGDKKGGGKWPSSISMKVPMLDGVMDRKKCSIKDYTGTAVELAGNVNGIPWTKCGIMVTGLYFQSKAWGITKRLVALHMGEAESAFDPESLVFPDDEFELPSVPVPVPAVELVFPTDDFELPSVQVETAPPPLLACNRKRKAPVAVSDVSKRSK